MSNTQYATIPSSAADRKAILDAFAEMSNAQVRIDSERDYIKESAAMLEEKFQVKKSVLMRLWKMYHKDTAREEFGKMTDIFEAYEALTGTSVEED